MRIQEVYSHLNGREHIQVHKPGMWEQIVEVIGGVDAADCRTKISKEKTKAGQLLYSPVAMNACYAGLLRTHGWMPSVTRYYVTANQDLIRKTLLLPQEQQRQLIIEAGFKPIPSSNQTDFVRDRIAIEIQFGKYAFVAYDMFVKHMAFFIGGVIDVGVEVLPMKALQAQMSSGVPYYESCLYDLLRQGRATLAAQADLSPKWAPSFVRMRELQREKFVLPNGPDPIWWRARGEPVYRRLTPDDVSALRERFARAGNLPRLDG